MKSIIVLFVSIFSTVAMACPQLAGSYTCTYDDGTTETLTVEQGVDNGVNVFVVDGDVFYADGQAHPISTEELVGTYVATCVGNAVNANVNADMYQQGSKIGMIQADLSLSQVSPGFVTMGTNGNVVVDNQVYPITESATCSLN